MFLLAAVNQIGLLTEATEHQLLRNGLAMAHFAVCNTMADRDEEPEEEVHSQLNALYTKEALGNKRRK